MVQQFCPTEVKESKAEKIKHVVVVLCHSLQDIRLRVGFVLLLGIFIGLGIPYLVLEIRGTKGEQHGPCVLEHEMRIDCLPRLSPEAQDREVCEKAGCCWEEFEFPVPNCFYPYPNEYIYTVNNVTILGCTEGCKLQISPSFNRTPAKTEISSIVDVSVEYLTPSHLRIFLDGGDSFDPYKHLEYKKFPPRNATNGNCLVSLQQRGIFRINVTRIGSQSPKREIFNTAYGPFIISRGLTQITTLLPSFDLYGIGQSPKNSFRNDPKFHKRYSLFSRMNYSNTSNETFSLSAGVHPFYLVMEEKGFSHGVLLVSSLPVEITVSGAPAVTFRTGDTRLDFHIFLGPTPAEVIRQLTEFVGRPSMPPYWALGYHSCRDAEDLTAAYDYINYTHIQRIPHESDCGSIQITDSSVLNDFARQLKETDRKLILFQSPHVPFSDEEEQKEFIVLRNSVGGGIYEGYLPEESVCYPDFFNSEDVGEWMKKRFNYLKFDGLFLDKNTPLNFNISNTLNCSCCQMGKENQLLQIANSVAQGTVCMGAIHNDGKPHVYYHNMYGYANMMKVKNVLLDLSNRRTFLTSLSTFTGSGIHGGHWGGPVESTWDNLKQAVTQTLDFSLFGIPLTGLPVCGSHGDFDQDLCSMWIQVAAFQPLMLSYRVDGQEPLMKLTSVARRTIQLRYSLLPYLYSLFHNATKLGDTVVRPLMVEFPKYKETYGLDEQFMWGSGLMVSLNLRSLRKLKVYFPPGCWYHFYSGKTESESTSGRYGNLNTIKNHVSLHIRGGHIIPTQPPDLSTVKSRKHTYIITIALNCLSREHLKGRVIKEGMVLAYGELFIDDGYSELSSDTNATNESLLVTVTVKGRNVTIESNSNDLTFQDEAIFSTILNEVRIYGLPEKPAAVLVDGTEASGYAYNAVLETFMISNLNFDLRYHHTISWRPETYVNL